MPLVNPRLTNSPILARPRDLLRLCRPHQWTKNAFVLAPLLFSAQLLEAEAIANALLACLSFCLASSAIYVFNDLFDAPIDRRHPRKKLRPIAAGHVSRRAASALFILLIGLTAAVSYYEPRNFLLVVAGYLANSILYCVWLKHHVIVDVMAIAAGFVLRLVAGCVAISAMPTSWIIVCGFSLALLLALGKRRVEVSQQMTREQRPSLQSYDKAKLDTLLSIATTICLVSYMMYTIAPDTVRRHGTEYLIFTVPFVAYGLFRYLFKAQEGCSGDGPAEIFLSDWVYSVTGLLWALSVVIILYLA